MKMDITIATAREFLEWVTLVALTLPVLEWSGREFVGDAYGRDGGPAVECCPFCKGIKPGAPMTAHFAPQAFGHHDNCALARLIREM